MAEQLLERSDVISIFTGVYDLPVLAKYSEKLGRKHDVTVLPARLLVRNTLDFQAFLQSNAIKESKSSNGLVENFPRHFQIKIEFLYNLFLTFSVLYIGFQ